MDSKLQSPLDQIISFNKLLEQYDVLAQSENSFIAQKAKYILDAQAPYPELRDGFTDITLLEKHKDVIEIILQDTFAGVLTNNEIKAASLPYDNVIFNVSERFKKILEDADAVDNEFSPHLRNLPEHHLYVLACTIVLGAHYKYQLDFKRPFFYDIPDKNGVMRHYRILYNADFMEIIPTDKSKKLTKKVFNELQENFDNLALWQEKIPPKSFICKGFVISSMFDVTNEHAISEIKSSLIANNKRGSEGFMKNLMQTFRSFFGISDIKVGFVTYNSKKNQFEKVFGVGIKSFLLKENAVEPCNEALCKSSYHKLINESTYFSISDVAALYERSGGARPYKNLKEQGIQSAIFAPIASEGELLGVLELVSMKKNALNSVNANKLEDIMPFIVSGVLRSMNEEVNRIDAIIQNECTSVHSAVYWKFKEEARQFMIDGMENKQVSFKEIVFNDVYPLYGQTDIKDSSLARNIGIQRDLLIQLSEIKGVINFALKVKKLPILEELLFRVQDYINEVKDVLHTNSEQAIFKFIQKEIVPIFSFLKSEYANQQGLFNLIVAYESKIDPQTKSYYDHRRNYDQSVMLINKKLSSIIDERQKEAQEMFPHYFERYKTDGVEHNMYIGASIAEEQAFHMLYLRNLRLWQLQVMCEMENEHYHLKPELKVPLDVASLILVYNASLSIRFRMDEKRFDVDGTYNARYEIIKKRIDKSFIKGTNLRLTIPGKMVVVYAQKSDEIEYLRAIKFLKSKGCFGGKIEILELEGLQGVTGLKAIRVDIKYATSLSPEKKYTYEDLMAEINN